MRRVRCCAVGLRIDPERATSPATFVAAVGELLDRHLGAVGDGADGGHPVGEVAADPDVHTLVALPEHTGLLAMLVGPRAGEARAALAAGASTMEVLTALAIGYGEVLGHVAARFPDVRSAGTLLHLACTDVMVRTLVDGLGGLAAERGIWLTVGAALPAWERRPVSALDPEVAALFRGGSAVALPSGPEVRNRHLILAPTGELVAVHDKVYLVPLEADAEQGLGLAPASLAEVAVADLPVGRVGTAISKDAWMPDVNARLDQLGAQVMVQPEASDRWGTPERGSDDRADLWPPDKFQRGGWWMVQRHPSFRANLTPMLLGHLGELGFDGQPLVAVPAPAGQPQLGLLGQPSDRGWAAVGPWAGLDEAPAALADPARRAAFEAHASRVTAGSGDPLEGAVSEAVACAEVELPVPPAPEAPPPRPTEVTASVAIVAADGAARAAPATEPVVARATDGAVELVPDLAVAGGQVWLTWIHADTAGTQAVLAAAGSEHGWGPAEQVAPQPGPGTDADPGVAGRRWRPRLAGGDEGPVCLHLGFPNDNWELYAARRGDGWAAAVRVDDAHDEPGVLRERLHDAPVLTRVGDRLLAVWSDLRWPWVLPQVRAAWSDDGGVTWSRSARVDGGSLEGRSDPLAPRSPHETRGQTAPTVTVTGDEVLVAWQERTTDGEPAVRLARLPDGSLGSPERVDAVPDAADLTGGGVGGRPPRANGRRSRVARPFLAAAGATVWLGWERWCPEGGARLELRTSPDRGRSWSAPVVVDPARPDGVVQRTATLLAAGEPQAVLVFEDDRAGPSRVMATTVAATGQVAPPVRVDDTPEQAHARAPTAAQVGDDLLVAWQDTRDGAERLRTSRLPVAALRG